jgi:regulator of PEP synthase PpsR (kinase-PPPase family)
MPPEQIEQPANTGRAPADQENIVSQFADWEAENTQVTENIIKEFDVANVIAEGVSVACNIVVIVCMSMDINEEIKNGSQRAGIVAMDIITVTVLSLQSTLGLIAMSMEGS